MIAILAAILMMLLAPDAAAKPRAPRQTAPRWTLNDTGQTTCYDDQRAIPCPAAGQPFFGQDAQCGANVLSFRANPDSTITDLVTGLTWTRAAYGRLSWSEALQQAHDVATGGFHDWRVPALRELYSIVDYSGRRDTTLAESRPFLSDDFALADDPVDPDAPQSNGLFWSATRGAPPADSDAFAVSFADGGVRGWPLRPLDGGRPALAFVRFVRGAPGYGIDAFEDLRDGTIVDRATGLMWQQSDSGDRLDWRAALAYADTLSLAGFDDWRLPNARELQSIADVSRVGIGRPAVDPRFDSRPGHDVYWTGTTLLDGPPEAPGESAVTIGFRTPGGGGVAADSTAAPSPAAPGGVVRGALKSGAHLARCVRNLTTAR